MGAFSILEYLEYYVCRIPRISRMVQSMGTTLRARMHLKASIHWRWWNVQRQEEIGSRKEIFVTHQPLTCKRWISLSTTLHWQSLRSKEVNNRHNKKEIAKSTRLLRSKADQIFHTWFRGTTFAFKWRQCFDWYIWWWGGWVTIVY